MHTLAIAVDYLLYGLVAPTIALVVYKSLHLWLPRIVGRTDMASVAAQDHEEFVEKLESGMVGLAVIATVAPFVGLAGTVMHIMEALARMTSASVDITLISGPIATSLNSTLIGLCAAVPALVAYNFMQRRIQVLDNRLRRKLGAKA